MLSQVTWDWLKTEERDWRYRRQYFVDPPSFPTIQIPCFPNRCEPPCNQKCQYLKTYAIIARLSTKYLKQVKNLSLSSMCEILYLLAKFSYHLGLNYWLEVVTLCLSLLLTQLPFRYLKLAFPYTLKDARSKHWVLYVTNES